MKKWIITISVIILLCGVLFFVIKSDEQDLGDNYFYLPKYEAIDLGYPGGGMVYKSSEKYLFKEIKITGNVAEAYSNKDFIIASQNTDTSYNKTMHSNVAKRKLTQYFIIEKKTDILFGPYNKEEYIKKREELGVPRGLQLKE